jgi:hypothetical protein
VSVTIFLSGYSIGGLASQYYSSKCGGRIDMVLTNVWISPRERLRDIHDALTTFHNITALLIFDLVRLPR